MNQNHLFVRGRQVLSEAHASVWHQEMLRMEQFQGTINTEN
jgi:hypothetical protein